VVVQPGTLAMGSSTRKRGADWGGRRIGFKVVALMLLETFERIRTGYHDS
jgi:hypothetical protein